MESLFYFLTVVTSAFTYSGQKRAMRKEEAKIAADLEARRHAQKTLVQPEKHESMLRWLDDRNNYPEIQEHMSSVLSEIFERDIKYVVFGPASQDIRSSIYFVENGFLPNLYADQLDRPCHIGPELRTYRMTRNEYWKLIIWVIKQFNKKGISIGLRGTGNLAHWAYVTLPF